MKKKSDRIGVGPHADSKKRWWTDKGLEASEPPSFQHYQFDSGFGRIRDQEEILSPQAFNVVYGDKSLEWHVAQLLQGIHQLVDNRST